MKLQKEELAAVASYVLDAIKEKNKVKLTKEEKAKLVAYFKMKEKQQTTINSIQQVMGQNKAALLKSFDVHFSSYYADNMESFEKEIIRARTKNIPTVDQIRKEIIMKSLFSDETELKKFIDELIAKF